jgi:SHS2 domain-containing protein
MGGYEIIEHTADVGITASARTIEELFEQTALGLFEILGAWQPGEGREISIELEPSDDAGLLVDWLNELLFLQDTNDIVFTGLKVGKVRDGLVATVDVASRAKTLEGTAVKAATHHQILVERDGDGWVSRVYVDV